MFTNLPGHYVPEGFFFDKSIKKVTEPLLQLPLFTFHGSPGKIHLPASGFLKSFSHSVGINARHHLFLQNTNAHLIINHKTQAANHFFIHPGNVKFPELMPNPVSKKFIVSYN